MRILFLLFFSASLIISQEGFVNFVNPFIGTSGHGHTYPGASLPFGMVQLSPDTDNQGWDWCSGYHYSDSTILGFSHTHLSGTGAGDYGDILFMPFTGKNYFNSGSKNGNEIGYRSKYNHNSEYAEPGYYSVNLSKNNISVELTATERCSFHRYIFPADSHKKIFINLEHGIQDQAIDTYFKLVSSKAIAGYRRSTGWAKDHTIFFYAEFNHEIDSVFFQNNELKENNDVRSKNLKVIITFKESQFRNLEVKVGISHTGIEGARKNFISEIKNFSFDEVRQIAKNKWEKELSRIKVYSLDKQKLKIFYTSLYHSFLTPNIQNDVDGKYVGMDSLIHIVNDRNQYTLFSLWDTFRALHPLINLLDKKRAVDFAISLMSKQREKGILPVWELASNETGTMIGYHSIPVISEMIMKNFSGFDYDSAFCVMKKSTFQDTLGINYLKSIGFIPMDKEDDAVSRTIEYSYDDWCIAQVAKKLGYTEDYKYFIQRAQNYKNVFDKTTGFMRGRNYDGSWKIKFDPTEPFPLGAGEFTEGSSWQYTWYVPHDINGLISLIGGEERFIEKLDYFFNSSAEGKYYIPADVTGLIGQYAHGNEPSHHIAYLYNYVDQPNKTQKLVRKILNEMYTDEVDGLIGNEDCGQMSAWYVFSSLGFYPVNPVANEYVIGSPIFDSAEVRLANGNKLKLIYKNQSNENVFINSIFIDGKEIRKSFLTYDEITSADEILYKLNSVPNDFGKGISCIPLSSINEEFIPSEKYHLFQPIINTNQTIFKDSILIAIDCITDSAKIFYSINNSDLFEYIYPLIIKSTSTLKFFSQKQNERSEIREINFIKGLIPNDDKEFPKIKFLTDYSNLYAGTSYNNLLDGIRATKNFRDGFWQGFYGKDFEIIIDLGSEESLKKVVIGLLRNQGSWIFFPKQIKMLSSNDSENFVAEDSIILGDAKLESEIEKKDFTLYLTHKLRYLKIIAETIGNCPSWHNGNGNPSWIFVDEIIIEKED